MKMFTLPCQSLSLTTSSSALHFCSISISSCCPPSSSSPPGSSRALAIRALGAPHNRILHDAALTKSLPSPALQEPVGEACGASALADKVRLVGGHDALCVSYSEQFVIRCYEVGVDRTASIEAIANLLQEVACNHVQSLGFSTDAFATTPSMRNRRLIWVTTRMQIEIDDYPTWGDVVQIETWFQSEGKLGMRRDWVLTNAATCKVIGRATSTWVMMNQDSRRLARITDDIRAELMFYCHDPPRWAFKKDSNSRLKKIPKLEFLPQYRRPGLMPRQGDLDMNQHVNNVTYIGWILEVCGNLVVCKIVTLLFLNLLCFNLCYCIWCLYISFCHIFLCKVLILFKQMP
eukprot:c23004_g1_i2 orf=1266-2306(-)